MAGSSSARSLSKAARWVSDKAWGKEIVPVAFMHSCFDNIKAKRFHNFNYKPRPARGFFRWQIQPLRASIPAKGSLLQTKNIAFLAGAFILSFSTTKRYHHENNNTTPSGTNQIQNPAAGNARAFVSNTTPVPRRR